MKVSEAVESMTKAYLHRIIDSFTKDFPKSEDADHSRDIIVRNAEELTDPDRIRSVLDLDEPYSDQILESTILETLINRPENRADQEELVKEVQTLQRAVVEEASADDALRYEDSFSVEIFRAVLEAALENEALVSEELPLIQRLREKLAIRTKTMHLIMAQLGHFPRSGNRAHSPSEIKEALLDLQRRGIVFYCNRLDKGRYVLPQEMAEPLKRVLGVEMTRQGWEMLLGELTSRQMSDILEAEGLPKGGPKEEKSQRIRVADLKPRHSLELLSSEDLYEILRGLPGAKVTGSKAERIDRIIEYFDKMVYREIPEEAPVGEVFYQYLAELAGRKREILLANDVIGKDREMDQAFEIGTRYLFSDKLGLELLDPNGSERPDGAVLVPDRNYVLMWDNKSKEGVYTFPRNHIKQFKRYIRECTERVGCFLVITHEVSDEAAEGAARLKAESEADTDVALITAEDLRWLAEQWCERQDGESFNPEVFNITGILDRSTLETRMKLFL